MLEVGIGTRLPIISWLSDKIMETVFSDRLETLSQHMAEEGENLKKLLEDGQQNEQSPEI